MKKARWATKSNGQTEGQFSVRNGAEAAAAELLRRRKAGESTCEKRHELAREATEVEAKACLQLVVWQPIGTHSHTGPVALTAPKLVMCASIIHS